MFECSRLDCSPSSRNQVPHNRDQGEHQQQMDEATRHMEGYKAQDPQNKEHDTNQQKHFYSPTECNFSCLLYEIPPFSTSLHSSQVLKTFPADNPRTSLCCGSNDCPRAQSTHAVRCNAAPVRSAPRGSCVKPGAGDPPQALPSSALPPQLRRSRSPSACVSLPTRSWRG